MLQDSRPKLTLLLAAPRGFCAGVDRAIQIVERALERYGAPVFVRHEIVHNRHVVDRLETMGAVFVERLDQCPDDRPVIFSAHGVPKRVPEVAKKRNMIFVDATCPLVSKVHVEAERHHAAERDIILIGHAGHPEVIGTMGQLPEGAISLVETVEDAHNISSEKPENLAFVTQTTLSVDDTSQIVAVLKSRFPQINAPHKEDICYATTNRQSAVKALAKRCDLVFVIGAPNSSNSVRLVEVALNAGARRAELISSANDVDWDKIGNIQTVGVTAGASAPDILVEELLEAFADRYEVTQEDVRVADENVVFKLPKAVD